MALVFDNATITAGATSANVRVLIHTAAANAVLLVFTQDSESTDVSAVAAGGVAMSKLATNLYFGGASRRQTVWGLTAPATGALTISAIHAGNNPSIWAIGAVTYTGHYTGVGGPFGGVDATSGTTQTQLILNVSSTAGNVIVALFGNTNIAGGASISVSGATTRLSAGLAGTGTLAIADLNATAATHPITATCAAAANLNWGALGINLIASASGVVTGVFSATDAQDTFAAPAYVLVQGTAAFTDAQDKFTSTAAVRISASFAATDQPDTFVATATVTDAKITGVFSATDAPDTFAATGYLPIQATFAATDSPDKFTATAQVIVQATFAATDAPDIFSASGFIAGVSRIAVFSATDAADTFLATAGVRITATLNATDTPDTFSASGYVAGAARIAVFNATDAPDIFSASATVIAVSVSAAAAPSVDSSAGHGKKSNNKIPYIRAPHEFWDAREAYLKSLQPEIESEPEPAPRKPTAAFKQAAPSAPIVFDPALLPSAIIERNRIITKAIPAATSMRQLRTAGDKLRAINAQIAEQKRLQLEAERAQRRAARRRLIKRNQKMLNALLAANAILSLYRNNRI